MLAGAPVQRANSRTVAGNTVWNLIGRIGPVAVALLVTPALVHALGDERWGVFTIVLSLVGAFGIFDFGLGRALTRAVAEKLGVGEAGEVAPLVMTGIVTAATFGLLAAGVTALLAGNWLRGGLQVSPQLHDEVLDSIYILCASAPLVLVNAAQWGVLGAFQKFRTANLINIPISIMYYVGPLLVLRLWNSLVAVMLVLVACRLSATFAYLKICLHAMPTLRLARPGRRHLGPLLRIGGWMTVSTTMYPILLYIDRFVIATKLGAAYTGYYSTPFDLVARFSIVSIAVNVSVFPAMAASFRADPANTVALFRRGVLGIAVLLFPACLVVVGFSTPLMTLWIGADFAEHAAPVMRWLGLGILFTCVDGVVFSLIDGIGRPDVNAKFSLAELALYLPVLLILLSQFGITGAAMAWAARSAADFSVRLVLARRLYPPARSSIRLVGPAILAGGLLLAVPLLGSGLAGRIALTMIAQATFLALVWFWSLTAAERTQVRDLPTVALGRLRRAG